MTNQSFNDSKTSFPTVLLSSEQAQYFSGGDGIYLADESGDILAFVHADNFDNHQQRLGKQESIEEAAALLGALESLVINQGGCLELDDRATGGLGLLLSEIKRRLTV